MLCLTQIKVPQRSERQRMRPMPLYMKREETIVLEPRAAQRCASTILPSPSLSLSKPRSNLCDKATLGLAQQLFTEKVDNEEGEGRIDARETLGRQEGPAERSPSRNERKPSNMKLSQVKSTSNVIGTTRCEKVQVSPPQKPLSQRLFKGKSGKVFVASHLVSTVEY